MAEASIALVLDCTDPDVLAPFWADALGLEHGGAVGNYVRLRSPSGSRPPLLLQRVGEAKVVKNRMHLDIESANVDEELVRLEAIGARRLESEPHVENGCRWVVMADPEGNEFCVCGPVHGAP